MANSLAGVIGSVSKLDNMKPKKKRLAGRGLSKQKPNVTFDVDLMPAKDIYGWVR